VEAAHAVPLLVEAEMSASTDCTNLVLIELGLRPWLAPPRPPASPRVAPRRAELASVRYLSVRETRSRWAAALTVEDQFAHRYLAIYHFEHANGGWRAAGSFLGPDRDLPGKPDPFLSLGALCADGVFFAGGRLQDRAGAVTRVELVWDDGQTLTDTIENGVTLFIGNRAAVDSATISFYGADGRLIASHRG
jgi:hypothetical protein